MFCDLQPIILSNKIRSTGGIEPMIAVRYFKELQLLTPANNVKYTGDKVKSQCTSQTIIYIRPYSEMW